MSRRAAKDRPGKSAWLGPLALGLGVLCWLTPIGGEVVAAVAIGSGVGSVATRGVYRVDWTAVTGICVGAGHLYLALLLFAMSATGL